MVSIKIETSYINCNNTEQLSLMFSCVCLPLCWLEFSPSRKRLLIPKITPNQRTTLTKAMTTIVTLAKHLNVPKMVHFLFVLKTLITQKKKSR